MTTSLNDLLGDGTADPDDTLVRPVGTAGPRRDRAADDLVEDAPIDADTEYDRSDDLFDDDALLAPPRTSRLTLVLVALLILMIGFFAGVQVERLLG